MTTVPPAGHIICPACYGYGPMSSMELVGIPGADPMYGCLRCATVKGDASSAAGYVIDPSQEP